MKGIQQMPDGYLNRTPIFQFILLSCLFPLWGAAASLNDILITQFKSVFTLSDFASALVQSAFYGGYFLIAIPASLVIKKTSYKVAILIGLTLYIIGCSMFYPASHMATYTMFLAAIFSIAIGLSFLETEGASLKEQLLTMSPDQAHEFKLSLLEHTLQPYKYLIFVLIAVTLLFLLTKFPRCKAENEVLATNVKFIDTLKYLSKNKQFKKGIIAQFLYVGMQVAVWSFTIRLALNLSNINERDASNFMIYSFIGFFIGKFVANFLMTKFKSDAVLFVYSILGVFTLSYTSFVHDFSAVYAAIFASVLFGPCWATIYTSVLGTVKQEHREVAGAVVVMSIIGAAVVPAIHGYVSDTLGSLQLAFVVPTLCFIYVGYYFWNKMKLEKGEE